MCIRDRYRRELFASYPDNVIAFRLTADKPGSISFKAHFEREVDNFEKNGVENILTLLGETQFGGHKFEIKIGFYPDGGCLGITPDEVFLEGADACTTVSYTHLQDPLAELVKIDPKSIGVGQYQHLSLIHI